MSFEAALDALVPTGTVRYTLDGVRLNCDKPVVLVSKHAGHSNRAFNNARFKAFARAREGKMTVERSEANRTTLAKLLAKYCVTAWENILEIPAVPQFVDGVPGPVVMQATPFSSAKCEEFLLALAAKAPDIFDAFVSFIGDADNFREEAMADAVTLGK